MRTISRPASPGVIIGYKRNGCPIWLIRGGAPEDGEQGSAGTDDGAGAAAGQENGQHEQDGGSGDGTGGRADDAGTGTGESRGSGDGGHGDDSAARTIAAIREDFKAERGKRQGLERELAAIKEAQATQAAATEQQRKDLARALGLTSDEPPDPAELARELAAARKATQDAIDASGARERALTVENALLKAARRHGADPELLADSRSFMATVAKLDPGSEDFAGELGEAIKAAVENNPAYKGAAAGATGASNAAGSNGAGTGAAGNGQQAGNGARTTAPPARSGTDGGHNGAPGGNRQWTLDDVRRASPQDVAKAQAAGLLADLGAPVGKKRV